MQPLVKRLRAARSDSGAYPISAIELLLTEAANEIERLQRIAYRQSSARPEEFKTVQQIRERHAEDDQARDFDGRAFQAHVDRAELLAIISFVSQQRAKSADSVDWTGRFGRLRDSIQPLKLAEDL